MQNIIARSLILQVSDKIFKIFILGLRIRKLLKFLGNLNGQMFKNKQKHTRSKIFEQEEIMQ